ncbi:MAG TPA: pro-sigmaK processing inhibitor BofA [Firmicutes bacterium]|nr:pro-sigmaK processing inhibitor BofA [Bacillota bacterium]
MTPDININIIIAYAFGLFLLYLIGRLFLVPLKIVMRLVYNGLIGGIALWLLNFMGSFLGIFIPINPITALTVGFLGLPGILLIFLLQHLSI